MNSIHCCCYGLFLVGVASSASAATQGPLPPAPDQQLAIKARRQLEEWNNSFRYNFNPWDVVTLQNAILASSTYGFIRANPTRTYSDDGLPL
jgi:hypothetical protein